MTAIGKGMPGAPVPLKQLTVYSCGQTGKALCLTLAQVKLQPLEQHAPQTAHMIGVQRERKGGTEEMNKKNSRRGNI